MRDSIPSHLDIYNDFWVHRNIPIDATIVLEILPQNRRWLLPLLSMWQPIGVVLTSVLSFALVPRFRCNTALPSCRTVAVGVACCSRTSNLGWRYLMIGKLFIKIRWGYLRALFAVCGCITLGVFLIRFAVFNFLESPSELLRAHGHGLRS